MWPFRRRRGRPPSGEHQRPLTVRTDMDRTDFASRVVRLHGPLDDGLANSVISQLLLHGHEDPHRPVTLDIDSPGGTVAATMAVVDAVQMVAAPVHTRCLGRAAAGRQSYWPPARRVSGPLVPSARS